MAQRQEQFQQEAYQSMQKAQQDAMAPIYKKLDEAIQAVGKTEVLSTFSTWPVPRYHS